MKKRIIITFAFTLVLFVSAYAQGQRGNPPSKEEMLKRTMTELTKEVKLTVEEKSSIEKIFTDFFSEMEDLRREDSRPDRSKMETLVANRDKKVKAVLSEEKYKSYTEFIETHRRGRGNPPDRN